MANMAIDGNDEQITSEMSRRFEHFDINDQECQDAYESAPVGDSRSSEYVPGFQLDPTDETNAKFMFYMPEPMHESMIFDPTIRIHDTTDIGFEESSIHLGLSQEIRVDRMDWAFVNVCVTVSISDL